MRSGAVGKQLYFSYPARGLGVGAVPGEQPEAALSSGFLHGASFA